MSEALYRAYCDEMTARGQERALEPHTLLPDGRVRVHGRDLVNFASNDYLGLSRRPELIEGAASAAARYGVGASASRLLSGNLDLFAPIETKLALAKGTEAALALGPGFLTNATVLPALLRKSTLKAEPRVYCDRLAHASLHAGIAAAGARERRYRHNDLDHLEMLLRRDGASPAPAFIVTESVFSMDGDQADVRSLVDLAERHGAFLYLDEAHATGVLGTRGFGLAAGYAGRIGLVMGTFSKALGCYGSYVACSTGLRRYLVQRCHGVIYSTALPPPAVGAIDAAIDLIPTLDRERAALLGNAERLRGRIRALGLDCGDSSTQIVPILVGGARRALAMKERLALAGYCVGAIRPPTVPPGTSRLRLSLTTHLSEADCDGLVEALGRALEVGP